MSTEPVGLDEVFKDGSRRRIGTVSPLLLSSMLAAGLLGMDAPVRMPAPSSALLRADWNRAQQKERLAKAAAKRARRNQVRPGRYP